MLRSSKFVLVGLAFSLAHCRPSASQEPLAPAEAGGATTIQNRSSNAFTLPAPELDAEEFALHAEGDRVFDAKFVSAPAPVHPGLGPVYNNVSCRSCHVRNGRGMPVIGGAGDLNSHMLLRLSLTPEEATRLGLTAAHPLAPIAIPGLGGQLQDHAIPGAEPEAAVELSWEELPGTYDDGTPYSLRRPRLRFKGSDEVLSGFSEARYLYSIRQSPPVFGLGLLEAVPEAEILAGQDPDDRDQDGIRGHANRVWDPVSQTMSLGRFGWKASAPNLLVQSAGAFAEDMGVSNPIFPGNDAKPDIDTKSLEAAAAYVQTLAVPARDPELRKNTQVGEALFTRLQCAVCHRPELRTGPDASFATLRQQRFQAYTDLLVHDMGEGLADHRPDFAANGREWRTAPLWGLGLTQTVLAQSAYLHDGRARTLEEAILWHDGEAAQAKAGFKALSHADRQALVRFLRSL